MIFYILNLLMLVLYSIGIKAIRLKNGNKILAIIFTIHFTLISGFRAIGVGTDTYTYQRIFLQTEMSSVSSIIQNSKLIGYQLLMKFITTFFGSNYHIFLFIVAMITNSLIFFTVYKMNNRSISQAGYLYFILYYFISSMNISRQFLALSLCFCSMYFISKNKYIVFILLIFIATTIHSVSFICLIFLILYRIKWSFIRYIFLIAITIILGRFSTFFFRLFAETARGYSVYTETLLTQNQGNRIYLTLFLAIFLTVCIFISLKGKLVFSNIVYFLQSVLIIAVVVGIIFAKDPLIIRVQQYFEFVFILYLPMFYLEYREQLVDRNKNTTLFIISYGIFLLLLVVPFVLQLSSNYGGIVPYMIYK